jgi:hypothetical protein
MGIIQDLEASRDDTLRYFTRGPKALARRYGPDTWCVAWVLHHSEFGPATLRPEFDKVALGAGFLDVREAG